MNTQPTRPGFWAHLAGWFFPIPAMAAEEEGAPYLYTPLETRLRARDRLRVLISGRIVTIVRVQTEAPAKPVKTEAMQFIAPPKGRA
jgi:hypothetical protein